MARHCLLADEKIVNRFNGLPSAYLGLRLDLDTSLVAEVMLEADIKIKKGHASTKAMDVNSIDANLLDAVVRLVRLAEEPQSSNVLAPLVVKEIIYRLLAGGQGARLGHLLPSGDTQRISQAIEHLREHLDESLKIDDFARQLGMSVSGFHHHFKSVTAMSPLQFQKQIRLQEARRLMLGEDLDAASAGFRVGYEVLHTSAATTRSSLARRLNAISPSIKIALQKRLTRYSGS